LNLNSNFVVVLSHPEIAENIGSVARCMVVFGIQELRLVGIKPLTEDSRALITARSGEPILKSVKYFADVREAIADCNQAFGFTRRSRNKEQKLYDLPDLAAQFENTRTALVFGCESQGLSEWEILQMTHLARIPPTHSESSLNLSHAVAIALYALVNAPKKNETEEDEVSRQDRVTIEESQAALTEILDTMDRSGFLARGKKEISKRKKFRILWQRLHPTRGELNFLSGALHSLIKKVEP